MQPSYKLPLGWTPLFSVTVGVNPNGNEPTRLQSQDAELFFLNSACVNMHVRHNVAIAKSLNKSGPTTLS